MNQSKSKVCEINNAAFLGFKVVKGAIRWTEKSHRAFKENVRGITKRTRGVSPWKVMEDLRTYVRGAVNYYEPGITYREARELDGWLRRRMRLYYWKQWGRPRTRRRNLLRLGIGRNEVKLASRSRKGPWRMSRNSLVCRGLSNQWLEKQGVPSVVNQWASTRYPDGPKKGRPRTP